MRKGTFFHCENQDVTPTRIFDAKRETSYRKKEKNYKELYSLHSCGLETKRIRRLFEM